MSALARLALRTVPVSWRDTIAADLADEAARNGRGGAWIALQALGVGIRLWWTIGGGSLMFDLRYALRSLWHARGFTIAAALTFALGIGVNLAIFSAVDRLLFRSLPFPSPKDIVVFRVCTQATGQCYGAFPQAIVREGNRLTTVGEFAMVGLPGVYPRSGSNDAPPIRLMEATPNLLRVVGVRPVLGRDVTDEEARSKVLVALLDYDAWQRRYHGDSSVLGQRFGTAAKSIEVIGVLPREFIPPGWTSTDPGWEGLLLSSDAGGFAPIARLRPGQSIRAAQAEITGLVSALAPQLRRANEPANAPPPYIQVDRLQDRLFERFTQYAWLVVGAAGLVLLMACANLSGLLLARGRSRERDAALRTALGASARRVVFASVLETGIVCAFGAGVALLVLAWSSRGLVAILPAMFSRYIEHVTDVRVITVTLLATSVSALFAGVWPGARASRVDVVSVLQGAGGPGRRSRLRGGRSLLAVEAALGVALVLGAATGVRSFVIMATEDIGYNPSNLFRLRMSGIPTGIPPAQHLTDYESILGASATVPGVVGVAGSDSVITNGATAMWGFTKDGSIRGGRFELTAGFFQTLGTKLVAGREFRSDEVESHAPVALMDRSGLEAVWPGTAPDAAIGRVLTLKDEVPRTIVGIAPQLFKNGHAEAPQPALYVPLGDQPRFYNEWLVRMAPGIAPPTGAIRERVVAVVGERRVDVASVEAALEPSLKDPRLRAILLGALGGCALLLAAAGLYALAAFEVSLRRFEMGVRLTLGASTQRIQRQVILGAVRPVLLGVLAGIVLAWWAGKFLQTFLYQVDARDPWTLALVALTLVATAALAAWAPARRAGRVDPAVVLRAQ